MGKPVEVTRVELSTRELRALAGDTRDGAVVRRLLAIALACFWIDRHVSNPLPRDADPPRNR